MLIALALPAIQLHTANPSIDTYPQNLLKTYNRMKAAFPGTLGGTPLNSGGSTTGAIGSPSTLGTSTTGPTNLLGGSVFGGSTGTAR